MTVRVGAGFMTSDMCPVSKGYSMHWMMHVWRSRVERERERERERRREREREKERVNVRPAWALL